jgi:hypothetical protein
MSTTSLEKKWDNIWPLACAVAAALERFERSAEPRDGATLTHMCRELKKAVDAICPTDAP